MIANQDDLKRTLKPRHIGLMALGSAIGTGLFLGSAAAIQLAGPSIILSYAVTGLVAFIVLRALGEMIVYDPVSGSFANYASKYISPLVGYLVGWSYWLYWIVVGLAQITAVGIYMSMWFIDTPQWIWAIASILSMGAINFISVKSVGEFGFWFSLIKVVAIIAVIAMGTAMIVFGVGNHGEAIGIANLWENGGFFPNGISGFFLSWQMVLFSYIGIEMIGISAGETNNPTKTIPVAINSTLRGITLLYVGSMFIILSIFPWNEIGTQGSPFVTIFDHMGLKMAAGIVNFVVITAALSSCNAGIFSGSRLLLGLAKDNNAPEMFAALSRAGVPINAVAFSVLPIILGIVISYLFPGKAFYYSTAAVTLIGLFVWLAILVTQIQFRKKLTKAQEISLSYKAICWPYASYLAIVFICFTIWLMWTSEVTRIGFYVVPPILFIAAIFHIGFKRYKS